MKSSRNYFCQFAKWLDYKGLKTEFSYTEGNHAISVVNASNDRFTLEVTGIDKYCNGRVGSLDLQHVLNWGDTIFTLRVEHNNFPDVDFLVSDFFRGLKDAIAQHLIEPEPLTYEEFKELEEQEKAFEAAESELSEEDINDFKDGSYSSGTEE